MANHAHRFDSDRIGAACTVCGMTQAEAIADYAEDQTLTGSFLPSKSVQRRLAHQQPEPTIPLTQVEAMLREAMAVTADIIRDNPSLEGRCIARDKWIANKIKEARGGTV